MFSKGRAYVVQRAKKIDPGQVDVAGSDVNIFVGSSSVIAYQVLRQLCYRTAALTLDGAEDEDLDRLIYDRYQEFRKGASSAKGRCQFRRPTFAAGAGTVGAGSRVRTGDGIEYILVTDASFGATDLSSAADVRAVEAGKDTQVGKNRINQFSEAASVFDGTITVNNDLETAGGENAETNDQVRNRVRKFWRTARRGVLSAIEFGALQVPGVVSAQAYEVLSPDGTAARLVNLYIADSSGVSNEQLANDVRDSLLEYRAGGIQVLIATSLPLLVGIQLKLTFRANVDTRTLSTNIQSGVVAFVNSLPVNGPLYKGQLFSVLQRYAEDGVIVNEGSILAPTGDLIPGVGQTIRTTLANVVLT